VSTNQERFCFAKMDQGMQYVGPKEYSVQELAVLGAYLADDGCWGSKVLLERYETVEVASPFLDETRVEEWRQGVRKFLQDNLVSKCDWEYFYQDARCWYPHPERVAREIAATLFAASDSSRRNMQDDLFSVFSKTTVTELKANKYIDVPLPEQVGNILGNPKEVLANLPY
jgi:hypothetical protein